MSFQSSYFPMPGAYHHDPSDHITPPRTLNADIFRPPITPSPAESTYGLGRSVISMATESTMSERPTILSRKRTRDEVFPTPRRRDDAGLEQSSHITPLRRVSRESEGNRYVLAGQIETPGAQMAPRDAILRDGMLRDGILSESVHTDVDYRRRLGPQPSRDDMVSQWKSMENRSPKTPSALPSPRTPGWSSAAISTLGGVVGKVWSFCTAGAFSGFKAGGGASYSFEGATPDGSQTQGLRSWDTLPNTPGQFPESDYMPYLADVHDAGSPSNESRPTAKRRQLGAQAGDDQDLRRSWVMVDAKAEGAQTARPSLGPRASHKKGARRVAAGPSTAQRTVNRASPATRQSLGFNNSPALLDVEREPASYANPRSRGGSPGPASPSKIPQPTLNLLTSSNPRPASPGVHGRSQSRQSLYGAISPPQSRAPTSHGHRRNTSTASAASTSRRRSIMTFNDISASPHLDDEAKHLATRKMAVEKKTDARIDNLNQRLQDMIRQGKEALGTQVEVDLGDDGWDDD